MVIEKSDVRTVEEKAVMGRLVGTSLGDSADDATILLPTVLTLLNARIAIA